ncbi:hypothetical protein NGM10_16565 (plasmid) [Halorussus salilacus]|uniref:hypothetical protein n=1 Tax=Halorussus salilacus TaxID=2953750 RepID=UPI00209E6C5A|nr:hypothetical protein [Halorussus salilacus]USZ69715.1 hypothetical protein NGM10_16565 [Halorussus salilacus]
MGPMDEAALLPTLVYVLLTVTLVILAVRTFEWFDLTGVTATLLALLVVFEAGVAYEGVQKALR